MRPDDVNVPLFLHVLGAGLLVGALLAVATAILLGWRTSPEGGDTAGLTRLGLWTVIAGVFPSYVLMRVGAQWTEAAEDLPAEVEDSAWIGIGYVTADIGALLILISMILAGIGLRRGRRAEGGGVRLGRIVGIVSVLLVAAYLVAVWAMAAKPD